MKDFLAFTIPLIILVCVYHVILFIFDKPSSEQRQITVTETKQANSKTRHAVIEVRDGESINVFCKVGDDQR